MATVLTRAEAAAAVAAKIAEHDEIQANLLELDASFGKRLLAGARLAGGSKAKWEETAAGLASVWETFSAYAEVVQRAAEMQPGSRRASGSQLAELTELLAGPSVTLTGEQVPLASRQLAGRGQGPERVSLDDAVQRMAGSFSRIAEVVSAAETVWTLVSGRLDQIGSQLSPASAQADGLADRGLTGMLASAESDLGGLRALLNADPLWFWQDGQVCTEDLDQLMRRAHAAAQQTAELVRVRADADRRIAQATAAVAAATAGEQEARAAHATALQKISAAQSVALPVSTSPLAGRLAGLDALKAAGRWPALAAELAAIEKDAADASGQWERAGQAGRALLDRRAELRGLLDAYEAKAGRLGAAENADLTRCYQRARDLLWSAPCDLTAAGAALRDYQQAVLALQRRLT
jgi:hypothetical protein